MAPGNQSRAGWGVMLEQVGRLIDAARQPHAATPRTPTVPGSPSPPATGRRSSARSRTGSWPEPGHTGYVTPVSRTDSSHSRCCAAWSRDLALEETRTG